VQGGAHSDLPGRERTIPEGCLDASFAGEQLGIYMAMVNSLLRSAAALALLAASIGAASACNRGREACSFILSNQTSYTLHSFWASPARVNKWENDILGRETLSSGSEAKVNLSDRRRDCVYDFKFRFVDGDEVTRERVNICELGRYTLND
jgi:hypothetical protein